jgi:8-oxo-dGTP pyrophosphatase MutT (NUDIX family)
MEAPFPLLLRIAMMDLQKLKTCLLKTPHDAPPEGDTGTQGDAPGRDVEALTPAAVLFALVPRPEGMQALLTRRTEHLRDHPGQISFPGGRMEPEDASPLATALREAEEEIGLAPHLPRPLGYLPTYRTATGFEIYPVVALLVPPFTLRLDAFEVAEAFEAPLDFLLDPANCRRESLFYRGKQREYHAIPYGSYHIWGATAGMILSLARRLSSLP